MTDTFEMFFPTNQNIKPTNALECFRDLETNTPVEESRAILRVLLRLVLQPLGMPKLQSDQKFSEEEFKAGYTFLEQLPVERISDFLDILDQQLQKLNLKKNTQAQYRCRVNKLVKHAQARGYIPKVADETIIPYRFAHEKGKRIKRKKLTNKGKTEKFALSFCPQDYPSPLFASAELQRLQAELEEPEAYLGKRGLGEGSIEMRIADIKKIWGMLHKYRGVDLKDLSLRSIVDFSPINISFSEFKDEEYDKYQYQKELAKENAKDVGKRTVKLLKWLFKNLPSSPLSHTKQRYVSSCIDLAKFIYRDETDSLNCPDYQDIPVVRRLRIFLSDCAEELKIQPSAVPYEEKSLTWVKAIEVLEMIRQEALMPYTWKKSSRVRCGYEKRKRPDTAVAHAIQKFILLALFILLPSERQEIYRELVIGKTLKHGLIKPENIFIPIDEMSDPSQARYYIDLSHGDYKTSDTYGEWMGVILDTPFSDGTSFYDYLDLWIYGGNVDNPLRSILQLKDNQPLRKILKPQEHDHVFLGRNKGMPMNRNTLCSLVKHLCERLSGVPVSPHTFRSMFRTYIDERGVSDEESKSIAYWMKHSSQTAQQYSRQQCSSKLRAGGELVMRINSELIQHVSEIDFRNED